MMTREQMSLRIGAVCVVVGSVVVLVFRTFLHGDLPTLGRPPRATSRRTRSILSFTWAVGSVSSSGQGDLSHSQVR
jgi:hypothetical protein